MNTAIEIRDLVKSYQRKHPVLKGVNMTVPAGKVYAFLGRNGAGKSTTIQIIAGHLLPDSGSVIVLNENPAADRPEWKRRVGYVAENQRIYDDYTLPGFAAFLKPFYPDWDDRIFAEYIKLFKLPMNMPIKRFSRGMYTLSTLLGVLCRKPELVILDDPTLGLDTAARYEFQEALIAALERFEHTVLLSSHQIPDMERLAEEIGILHDGKMLLEGSLDEIKREFRELRFPAPPPSIPGEIRRQQQGTEWVVIVRAKEAELGSILKTPCCTNALSLEQIFLALCAG